MYLYWQITLDSREQLPYNFEEAATATTEEKRATQEGLVTRFKVRE